MATVPMGHGTNFKPNVPSHRTNPMGFQETSLLTHIRTAVSSEIQKLI